MPQRSQSDQRSPGFLKIIGGDWRGRRLPVPDLPGLRPTNSRHRETLFNWLQTAPYKYCCLDLFSGSGALGLEALSRGAGHTDFVEVAAPACRQIEQNLRTLGAAERARIAQQSAETFIRNQSSRDAYDVVFLDPPFNQGLLTPTLALLAKSHCLKPGAQVYIEAEKGWSVDSLPEGFELYRHKRTGSLQYGLLHWRQEAGDA